MSGGSGWCMSSDGQVSTHLARLHIGKHGDGIAYVLKEGASKDPEATTRAIEDVEKARHYLEGAERLFQRAMDHYLHGHLPISAVTNALLALKEVHQKWDELQLRAVRLEHGLGAEKKEEPKDG